MERLFTLPDADRGKHSDPWGGTTWLKRATRTICSTRCGNRFCRSASHDTRRPEGLRHFVGSVPCGAGLQPCEADNGEAIRGLGPEDFEILENGVPQQVDLVGFDQIPLNVILALDMSDSVAGERLEQLRDVSSFTGGRLFEIEKTANLASTFLSILEEFRHR